MEQTEQNLLRINDIIQEVKRQISSIERQARKEGMTTMFEDGIIKAAQGITTLEEVMRVTTE